MKSTSYKIAKNWIPRFIILIAIILLVFSLYYIYQNVWQVFASSKKNLLIQQEVVPTELKVELFKTIEERIANKQKLNPLTLDNLKNPFSTATKKLEEPKLK